MIGGNVGSSGSRWLRWEPHIHAPGTVLNDQFNGIVGFGNPPLLDAVSSRGQCTQNNTQVTCAAGDIEGKGTWTVTIRGIVTAAGGTTVNNIATVTANKSATTYTESAAATTQVTSTSPGGDSPDLTIGKNGPLSAAAGGDITYTLTVNNIGNKAATGIKVTDTVPLDTAFPITATGTSLFSCNVAGADVTCTGGQINAGANGTITIKGTANIPHIWKAVPYHPFMPAPTPMSPPLT